MFSIHLHFFITQHLCRYSKRLPLQHFIKDYGIYINLDNITFKASADALLLAYKSIDIEARSRRRKLLFHGLAESRSENCTELLRNFLWDEMGIDSDDLFIERVHRLGSLHKAKLKSEIPRRPIIVAFYEYQHTEKILDAAYMLRGTIFSVSRDYPKEIVSVRQRLMPQFKAERQNKNNKVSLEYPAKLVVNGRVVADEFPDWFSVLGQNRYKLANGGPYIDQNNSIRGPYQVNNSQQQQQQQQQERQ